MRCVAYYKYGKIDTSIGSMVCEMGQLGEVVVARMLDDEHRAFLQQARLEHQLRNFGKARQGIRRVGKDDVKRAAGRGNEAEHVATHECQVFLVEFLRYFFYELALHVAFFHGRDSLASARKQFEAHGSRAGKQIESCQLLEINKVFEHVE